VKDVNIVTRHRKKNGTTPGQIEKFEKAVDVSNVSLICPITDKATKIGYVEIEEKGIKKKFRYSKKAMTEGKKAASDCIIK
jgi:large subunit ribosomal protein L24